MTFLPSVTRAEHNGGLRILLTFHDDLQPTLAFRQWLKEQIVEPLKNPDYFGRFFVDGGLGLEMIEFDRAAPGHDERKTDCASGRGR